MTICLEVSLSSVYQRVGKLSHCETYTTELRPTVFASPDYGLLLYWPREVSWLRVRPTLLSTPNPREFLETEVELDRVCQRFGTTRGRLCPPDRPDFFRHHSLRVLDVQRALPIQLEFIIDTDAGAFLDAANKAQQGGGNGELVAVIDLLAFDGRSTDLLNEPGDVLLKLRPGTAIPPFQGCVALDLGNTSSSVACLPPGKDSTRDLRVLCGEGERVRLLHDADPTYSHVRIDQVLTWVAPSAPPGRPGSPSTRRFPSFPHDDLPQAVGWVIGSVAGVGTTKGLVLGAKRLVVGQNWEQPQRLLIKHDMQYKNPPWSQDEQIDVLNRVPAELLACRLLQQFTRATRDDDDTPAGWPRYLALTYPTTFSPREIDRLRRTIYRAWLRLHFKTQQYRPNHGDQPARRLGPSDHHLTRCVTDLQRRLTSRTGDDVRDDPLIRLMLDEASAAAFFFLYRKVLESPGGLAGFRYRYPDGLNLLLYDCGGGTTDIALVSASLDEANPACLRIRVRGRTGVRHFGGDNITEAVFRLLKAKLAREVARNQGMERIPSLPTHSPAEVSLDDRLRLRAKVQAFLREMAAEAFDGEPSPLVPTRFDRHRTDADSNRRREHANTLWNWAEELKQKLEAAETAKLGNLSFKIGLGQSRLADALLHCCGGDSVALQQLVGELEKITIHRWEVDALIGRIVLRSVRNCNALIREQLGGPPPGRERTGDPDDEEMVHWVVASGNGSRYPLIREALLERLAIPSLSQEGRFTHDVANLKHAVAKGAALALSTLRGQGTVRIEFDTELSNCLPFDVGYNDLRINDHITLFHQGIRYDRLGSQTVPLAALTVSHLHQAGGPQLYEFTLLRHFPGDGEGADPDDGDEPDALTLNRGWSDYVTYHFEEGINSDLTVSYDQEAHEFLVRDTREAEGKPLEVTPEAVYRSPPQRGDL